MVDIHSARQDAKYIRNAGYGTAATIIEELCDEVKRLTDAAAEERSAVVAWLRAEARKVGASPDEKNMLRYAVQCFERGEHRREEER